MCPYKTPAHAGGQAAIIEPLLYAFQAIAIIDVIGQIIAPPHARELAPASARHGAVKRGVAIGGEGRHSLDHPLMMERHL